MKRPNRNTVSIATHAANRVRLFSICLIRVLKAFWPLDNAAWSGWVAMLTVLFDLLMGE